MTGDIAMQILRLTVAISALGLGCAAISAHAGGPKSINTCQTITESGSYIVEKNLTATGTDHCLVVETNNVTIDLNGFALIGSGGVQSGDGITDGASVLRESIVVRNGVVTDFDNGIDLSLTVGAIVEGLRAVGNERFGILVDSNGPPSTGGIVRNNVAHRNGLSGIRALNSFIEGNYSTDNGLYGIEGGNGSVIGNVARENVIAGFHVGGGTVANNTASSNGDNGFDVGRGTTLVGNTAVDNGDIGFEIDCPSNVRGNTAWNNGGVGIT
jgi:hypothetical protein